MRNTLVLGTIGFAVLLTAALLIVGGNDANGQDLLVLPPTVTATWDSAIGGPRCDFDGGTAARWVNYMVTKKRPEWENPQTLSTGNGSEYGFDSYCCTNDPPGTIYDFNLTFFDARVNGNITSTHFVSVIRP